MSIDDGYTYDIHDIDLDAVEAHLIDRSMPGPWRVQYKGDARYVTGDGNRIVGDIFQADDAKFISQSRSLVPALIERIRIAESSRSNTQQLSPRVLEGDWETVRDALDALPEGTQIRWRTGDPIHVSLAIKIINVVGNTRWSATDGRYMPSESIARDETPIEVIA